MSVFLSTPSARRATQGLEQYNRHNQNFYPRPLRGGRPSATAKYTASKNFYPRPLRGGRLLLVFEQAGLFVISIHALCEEGDNLWERSEPYARRFLSTPSARRATRADRPHGLALHISIHALCEEGDYLLDLLGRMTDEFLSTPSARRATESGLRCAGGFPYFYPRPLRGGRPPYGIDYQSGRKISIHALCEEGDRSLRPIQRPTSSFLSTPSARRATEELGISQEELAKFLSTPSARRATRGWSAATCSPSYFYPRPLRGGRRQPSASAAGSTDFYPRPLRGGRPGKAAVLFGGQVISIHALCEEGDQAGAVTSASVFGFLSTPSARRATG